MQEDGKENNDSHSVDGGDGFDTLVTSDNHMNIDLSILDGKVSNIEAINLNGGENTLVNIKLEDVINITDDENILRIDGTENDTVSLNTKGDDAEWKLGDFKTDNESTNHGYQEYVSTEDNSVSIEVDSNIHIDES